MTLNTCRTRLANAGVLGALAVSLSGAGAAQAQDKQKITLTGVVTRNPEIGYFVMRARNNWTYRVDTRVFKPLTLTTGDRVRAYGDWSKGVLLAENVRILRHGGTIGRRYKTHPNRTITGSVIENRPDDEFVLQARNGWTYVVRAVWGEPSTLSAGDRLRAYGTWRDGLLEATNLRILYDGSVMRNTPEPPAASAGNNLTRRLSSARGVNLASRQATTPRPLYGISRAGTVTSNLAGNEFMLRQAGGTTFRVRALRGEPATLSVGDHVRVFGDLRNDVIEATNVRVAYQAEDLDPDPYDENRYDYSRDRENRTITGTVTSNPSGDRFTLRASNGYTYAVRAISGEPSTLTAGDRVRVYGAWREGVIQAANVRVLREGRNPKNWKTHTWVGTVTENMTGDRFLFRVTNGITYRVLAVWGEPSTLSVGDRVRAYGEWRNGMLHASNVRVLRQG